MTDGGVLNLTKPRGAIAAMYRSPGPCYPLPNLTGKSNHDPRTTHTNAPAFPFGVRHGKMKDDCSPGPCYLPHPTIIRSGKDGTPHFSLYSRLPGLKAFSNPGPGAYSPEKAGPNSKAVAPIFSFGSRHRHRRSDNNPAPNSYSMDPTVGRTVRSGMPQAASYSLTGRSGTGSFHEDLQKTPGPGAYSTVEPQITKNKCPQYSMTSRHVMPGDATQKPGPGAHSPEKVIVNKKRQPKYSFGIRHSQFLTPLILDPVD